jgi:hypothetical protein
MIKSPVMWEGAAVVAASEMRKRGEYNSNHYQCGCCVFEFDLLFGRIGASNNNRFWGFLLNGARKGSTHASAGGIVWIKVVFDDSLCCSLDLIAGERSDGREEEHLAQMISD